MNPNWILVVATAITSAVLNSDAKTSAQELRIESDVYVDDKQEPVAENLTIFRDNRVYDFQLAQKSETPIEVVVYDFENKSFVLMDPSRLVKYEIESSGLQYFVDALRNEHQMVKRMPFMFRPELDESFDEATGWLTLSSDKLQYRCKGKVVEGHAEAMKKYFEFINQSTRLNATDPHKLPPFARLELNRAIGERNWMPQAVEMKLDLSGPDIARKIKANSRHYVIWKLSKQDARRIESAEKMLQEYKSVGLETYRKLDR